MQGIRSVRSALRHFDDLLGDNPCGGVVYRLQTQSLADAL